MNGPEVERKGKKKVEISRKDKSLKTDSRSVVAWGLEQVQGLTTGGQEGTFLVDGNLLAVNFVDGHTTISMYIY